MKITNKFNLPAALYDCILAQRREYRRSGDFSTSQLCSPPRAVALSRRYFDQIEQDASELLWAFVGTAVHNELSRHQHSEVLKEEEFTMPTSWGLLSGRPDVYSAEEKAIRDYKVTSVWSVIYGGKDEWEWQGNINAQLLRHYGFPVEKIRYDLILRDWKASEAERKADYPRLQYHEIEVPLWGEIESIRFIEERMRKIVAAENDLPLCTPEERWVRGESWAVTKVGNKKAARVFEDPMSAHNLAKDLFDAGKGKHEVTHREGKAQRCEKYCLAAPFCYQFQKEKEERGNGEASEQTD